MSDGWARWWRTVQAGLDAGCAPGGAVWISHRGEVVLHAAHGWSTLDPAPEALRLDHWFDLASITKAIATTTCVLALVEDGRLDLDQPLAVWLPPLTAAGKGSLTARHLLTHTSGLPPWVHFYETCADRAAVRQAALATPLEVEPGQRVAYSDVGFLTLGWLVEAIAGQRLDQYLHDRVLAPAGLAAELGYGPRPPADCAATERCRLRGRVMRGEVHDENAWWCDGVAGHAGLFGTVAAVGEFGRRLAAGEVLREATLATIFARREDIAAAAFWLGWKRLRYDLDDDAAFGHDGFTGTLLWVSPARELVIALLTNRVHPTRDNRLLYDHRPRWIRAAAAVAGG